MLFVFRARREDRWHSRTAEQNHGGVETGAIYGGENTSQVNYTLDSRKERLEQCIHTHTLHVRSNNLWWH